jgi:4-carboxymuconolactone decarboxylase
MDASAVATYREVMAADPPSGLAATDEARLERLFGEVWSSPVLGRRERRLVTIQCLAFAITPEPILEHLYAAMKTGDLTIAELLEVDLHFAVYCGWPKASNLEMYVRQTWVRVQQEDGIDPPTPLPMLSTDELGDNDWEARLQRGEREFADVNLVPAPPRDTPYQHAGILNFVFGHVWQRPGLNRRDRRFVTVPCVGVCEAPIPISAHVGSALKTGEISKAEMDELIRHFGAYTDDRRAAALQAAADQAWADHQANGGS